MFKNKSKCDFVINCDNNYYRFTFKEDNSKYKNLIYKENVYTRLEYELNILSHSPKDNIKAWKKLPKINDKLLKSFNSQTLNFF
jgi:hypothetical protein